MGFAKSAQYSLASLPASINKTGLLITVAAAKPGKGGKTPGGAQGAPASMLEVINRTNTVAAANDSAAAMVLAMIM